MPLNKMLTIPERVETSFYKRIYHDHKTGCWRWTGHVNAKGYGNFAFSLDGRVQSWWVHRFSYELHVGPIPKGMEIDHLCKVRCCVNPLHLEAVTKEENILRSDGVSSLNKRKTHCKNGHVFDAENTSFYVSVSRKNPRRRCKTCHRERMREINALNRKPKQSSCKRGHIFDTQNTYFDKDGFRHCRICDMEKQRRYRRDRGVKIKGDGTYKTKIAIARLMEALLSA